MRQGSSAEALCAGTASVGIAPGKRSEGVKKETLLHIPGETNRVENRYFPEGLPNWNTSALGNS